MGVLEYWESQSPNFNLDYSFHYSITPPLHYSSRLSDEGKFSSGGSSKPGLLDLDSLQGADAAEMMASLRGEKEGINYG